METFKIRIQDYLKKFLLGMIRFFSRAFKNRYVRFAGLLYLVGLLIFGITLFRNNMTIPMSGDFVLQEIPFYFNGYDDIWTALKTGHFPLWDESAFLGANNIGANTFYYLLNPFFLPILLFPRNLIPQAQAFMMITKMVLAGLAMMKLLELFELKSGTIKIVALAYAFNGWNLHYLWFNHFLEVNVLMPVLLYGIERVLRDKNPFYLVFGVFLIGITNYFFLVSFCFLGVLYAGFRYFQFIKKYSFKEGLEVFIKGFCGFAFGLMLASFVIIPAFSSVLSSSRVTNATYLPRLVESFDMIKAALKGEGDFNEALHGFSDVLFVWDDEGKRLKYLLYPLTTFFFGPAANYDGLLFKNNYYDNTLSSLYLYAPLVLFFFPSVFDLVKRKKFGQIFGVLFIILLLFTPFAYYCFSGFTGVAYGRWHIFVVAVTAIFIAINIDRRKQINKIFFDIGFVLTIIIQIWLINYTQTLIGVPNSGTVAATDNRIYLAYFEIGMVVVSYYFIRRDLRRTKFYENILYLVILEAVVVGNTVVNIQGTSSYQNLYGGIANVDEETRLVSEIQDEDDSYYRIFTTSASRNANNLAMMLGSRGLGTFHSVYNYELQEFIDWSRIAYQGSWSMGIHEKRANLDEFLNVKYYILSRGDTNVPYGFSLYKETDNHRVYRNDNYMELGFAFDNLIDKINLNRGYDYTNVNELFYLSGAIVSEEDATEILKQYPSFVYNQHMNYPRTLNAAQETVQVQKAIWTGSTHGGRDDEYEAPVSFTTEATRALTWNSRVDIRFNQMNVCSEAKERGGCFVSVRARMGENLNILLYGEDEEGNEVLLTSDRHMTHGYGNKESDRKYQRGFYVNDEVVHIRIMVLETMSDKQTLVFPEVQYEYYDDYKARIDKLKPYALKDVKFGQDWFSFMTDYSDLRFVVLTIPYDSGWSLNKKDAKGNTEEVKIYKAQGGFVGFVADEGEFTYELSYQTPGLATGLKVVLIGMVLTVAMYIVDKIIFDDKGKLKKAMKLN